MKFELRNKVENNGSLLRIPYLKPAWPAGGISKQSRLHKAIVREDFYLCELLHEHSK
jgi:hypothetical protein